MGAGCWSFGGGTYWGSQDQKDVNAVVHESVQVGINYFDTAEAYNEGRSEEALGMAMKGVARDKFIVGTKVSPSNCYPDTLVAHCEASLKRLATDYIDIYMIHWPIHPHSIRHFTEDASVIAHPPVIAEAMDALRGLQQAGKIRAFGVSNFARTRLQELPLAEIAVNELPYNLLCRAIEYDALPFCLEHNVGVIGYMALLQGILADNYATLDDVPVWQRRTRHFNAAGTQECRHGEAGAEAETNAALEGIRQLSRECGLRMPDLALKWILETAGITCTLVGSRNINQLYENVRAAETPLPDGVKEALDKLTTPLKETLGNHFDYYESTANDRTV